VPYVFLSQTILKFAIKKSGQVRNLNNDNINLTFRRSFESSYEQEWADLSSLVEGTSLSNSPDSVKWCIDKKGNFTTASLSNELLFPSFENKWMMCVWKAKIPVKIRIFR
jgi:hypothetical protein